MSVTAAPPPPAGYAGAGVATGPGPPTARETCPLCGAPLEPEQEWCLRCGAAARTRLAASSNRKAPILAFAVVALLSLGVLAASLVKLAGDSGSPGGTVTRTVIGAPAAAVPTTATAAPPASATGATGTGATAPGTKAPGAAIPPASATAPVKTPPSTATSPGAAVVRSPAFTRHLIELETERKRSKSPTEKRRLLELETRLRSGK